MEVFECATVVLAQSIWHVSCRSVFCLHGTVLEHVIMKCLACTSILKVNSRNASCLQVTAAGHVISFHAVGAMLVGLAVVLLHDC